MYCVKCKKQTETKDIQTSMNKNGRPMMRGACTVCGTTKTQFVKGKTSPVEGGDLVGSLNMLTSNTKLPWGKFPGEMHLPGHQFTGVTGQNGTGQNGTDKMVRTKWYTDKMVWDKMVWTKWYGQNGTDNW